MNATPREAPALLLELTRRYSEPHRRYHTLVHIAAMLDGAKAWALSDAQVLAIWFHDAVYVPGSATNEADSAALAREWMARAGHGEAERREVEAVILATRDHEPTTPACDEVIDLDLAILAAPAADYDRYVARVREEYAAVDDIAWRFGRAAFLQSFLARPAIFRSERGRAWEAPARANLARELGELSL